MSPKQLFLTLIISALIQFSLADGSVNLTMNNFDDEDLKPALLSESALGSAFIEGQFDNDFLSPDASLKKKVYKGQATYYSDKYQGKPTASGELYDKDKYTAAIRTNALSFEFGTMVEVTSVKTGKKVKVKVNDKMSNKAEAVIDLSRVAAEKIGLINAGRMDVEIRVVK